MYSIFEEKSYQEIKKRLSSIKKDSTPSWGKMNVEQMLKHCQCPLRIFVKEAPDLTPSFFMKLFLRMFKKSMYDDSPWRKSLPTPKPFIITDTVSFEVERDKLLQLVEKTYHIDKENLPIHSSFGKFTEHQWGQMHYKHLDYHFKQFGV